MGSEVKPRVMRKRQARTGERRTSQCRRAWKSRVLAMLVLVPLALGSLPALGAPSQDDDRTFKLHPLRIVALVLHPVGVILDTLIVRPIEWLGSKEPIKTLVGNTD